MRWQGVQSNMVQQLMLATSPMSKLLLWFPPTASLNHEHPQHRSPHVHRLGSYPPGGSDPTLLVARLPPLSCSHPTSLRYYLRLRHMIRMPFIHPSLDVLALSFGPRSTEENATPQSSSFQLFVLSAMNYFRSWDGFQRWNCQDWSDGGQTAQIR